MERDSRIQLPEVAHLMVWLHQQMSTKTTNPIIKTLTVQLKPQQVIEKRLTKVEGSSTNSFLAAKEQKGKHKSIDKYNKEK